MEPIEFKRMVLQFSRVGYVLTKTEVTAALKISYAIKKHLQRKALQSLAAFPREPSMMIYMADGWGASVFETLTKPVSGTHLVVTRKGRFRHEFLLQRGLVRQSLSTGEQKLFTLMEDPLGLSKGKGSWNVFSANLMFFQLCGTLDAQGLPLTFTCWMERCSQLWTESLRPNICCITRVALLWVVTLAVCSFPIGPFACCVRRTL